MRPVRVGPRAARPPFAGRSAKLGAGSCAPCRSDAIGDANVNAEGSNTDVTEVLPILLHPVVAILYAATAWMCYPHADRAPGATRHVSALVAVALLLHAIGIGRAIVTPTGIDLSLAHALSLVAGLAVLVAWATGLIRALPAVGAVVLPVAALAAVLPVLSASTHRLPYTNVPWASVHIAIALSAYAILIVAAAEALVLTGIERRLHRGLPNPGTATSPPLLTLERWLFLLIGIGYVLLTLTLASGIFYSEELFGTPARFNHKNVFSVAAWLTYSALLIGRWRFGWRGRRALKWILAGTVLLLLAYVGSKFVVEVLLHR